MNSFSSTAMRRSSSHGSLATAAAAQAPRVSRLGMLSKCPSHGSLFSLAAAPQHSQPPSRRLSMMQESGDLGTVASPRASCQVTHAAWGDAASAAAAGAASTSGATTAATAAAVGAAGAVLYQQGAFASLTRVFLVGPNPVQGLVRGLAGARKWRAAGPVSVLLFLFGLMAAIVAAVRSVLVKRVKSCKCCRGYGIVRCRLCNGDGAVEWSGKSTHQEMCPLCMTRRYVSCPDCGGHYHKRMFTHMKAPTAKALVPEFLS